MTTGGGRESGGDRGRTTPGQAGNPQDTAAANPAAAHVHRIMNVEEPPYAEDCLPCKEREARVAELSVLIRGHPDCLKCTDYVKARELEEQ